MNLIAAAALLLSGSVALFWGGRVKEDVTIGGVQVGGLPYAAAEELVRARLLEELPPFTVRSPAGDFSFGLSVSDDAARLVRRAKRGETLELSYTLRWVNEEEELLRLCRRNAREAENAALRFSKEGFSYTSEREGIACDYRAALLAAEEAIAAGEREMRLPIFCYAPKVTERELRERTRRLSSFTTRFDGSNSPRAHNIALAAERVSGTVLLPGEEFSFNRTVGERTEENGFEVASVISDGEFVPGVGGGVCQASTTLFGAALRAGLAVTESRAHSLSVGYVPPSLDAMVSSVSDLRFFNPYPQPVYLLGKAEEGTVRFEIFGLPDGKRYEAESVVLSRIPPPPPEETEGGAFREGKEGLTSESYLNVYAEDGTLLSRTRIRRDSYAPLRGRTAAKKELSPLEGEETGQNGAEGEENGQKIPVSRAKTVDFS